VPFYELCGQARRGGRGSPSRQFSRIPPVLCLCTTLRGTPSKVTRRFAARREDLITSKLFVGNLSFQTTREELEALFAEEGAIQEVFLPTDRESGRMRGFAFVTYESEDVAARAMERFNGFELGGRALRVNSADDAPRRSPSGGGGGGDRSFGGGGGGGGGRFGGAAKPKGSRRNIRGKKRSL